MPQHAELIELDAGTGAALARCRVVLEASGWEITRVTENGLCAREEPWRLGCRTAPTQLEITAIDSGAATALSVRASAPGIGPIPGPARLRRQLAALRQRVAGTEARNSA